MAFWPELSPALAAFGQAGTVQRDEDATPIPTTVIWLSPLEDAQPVGFEFARVGPRRVLCVPKSDVPNAPIGTKIVAPEPESTMAKRWQVEGHLQAVEPDLLRLVVVPLECE